MGSTSAAWLHHRFTQIHPFQDGNGRVARALASLVFLKAGMFPLVIRNAERTTYIEALEAADGGNLQPLINLFAKRQRAAILGAIGLEQSVQQASFAEEIISSAVQVLKDKFAGETALLDGVYPIADELRVTAEERFSKVAQALDKQLQPLTPSGKMDYHANVRSADAQSAESSYYYLQIVGTAKTFDYFGNLDRYRFWVRIAIATDRIFEILISFHGIGKIENGVMVASACSFQRVKEGGGRY